MRENNMGLSGEKNEAVSGSSTWPPSAAQVGPPPRPSYLEGNGTCAPPFFTSSSGLEGKAKEMCPTHIACTMSAQLRKSP